jgi:hypothetical protein
MEWIQTQSFPRLKSLDVYLSRDNRHVERPHFSQQAISFFRSFEPLKQLSIVGSMDQQIVDAVFACHGQSLRKLSLHPLEAIPLPPMGRDPQDIPFHFTKDCVLQLRDQSPNLEELTILVKHNMSRTSEANLYKSFDEMRKLRALSLILDCSNWRVTRDPTNKPDFDEQLQEHVGAEYPSWLKRGDVKETFINCAIDEALACSIWRTISQIKTGRPLERLKLWPTGAGEYGTGTRMTWKFSGIVYELARSWSIERRGDTQDFTVKELQRERRLMLRERYASFMSHRQKHDAWVWSICRSIWPSQDGSDDSQEDWSKLRDAWSSFPLEEKSRGS